jgi:hypothetical protein
VHLWLLRCQCAVAAPSELVDFLIDPLQRVPAGMRGRRTRSREAAADSRRNS